MEILQPVAGEILLVRVIAQEIWWGSEQDFSLVLSGPVEEYVDLNDSKNIPPVELISFPSPSSCNTSPTFTFALKIMPNMSEVYIHEASTICRVRKVDEQDAPWQACESQFKVGWLVGWSVGLFICLSVVTRVASNAKTQKALSCCLYLSLPILQSLPVGTGNHIFEVVGTVTVDGNQVVGSPTQYLFTIEDLPENAPTYNMIDGSSGNTIEPFSIVNGLSTSVRLVSDTGLSSSQIDDFSCRMTLLPSAPVAWGTSFSVDPIVSDWAPCSTDWVPDLAGDGVVIFEAALKSPNSTQSSCSWTVEIYWDSTLPSVSVQRLPRLSTDPNGRTEFEFSIADVVPSLSIWSERSSIYPQSQNIVSAKCALYQVKSAGSADGAESPTLVQERSDCSSPDRYEQLTEGNIYRYDVTVQDWAGNEKTTSLNEFLFYNEEPTLSVIFLCDDETIILTEDLQSIILNENRQRCSMEVQIKGGGGDANQTKCRYAQVDGNSGSELSMDFGQCRNEIEASNSSGKEKGVDSVRA